MSLIPVERTIWGIWQILLRGKYNKTPMVFFFLYFRPMFYFHTPWTLRETSGFPSFWGDIEMELKSAIIESSVKDFILSLKQNDQRRKYSS